jgi:hypothetical protein
MRQLLDIYDQKGQDNLDRGSADPELFTTGKLPTTGTGWLNPINNRGGLRDNINKGGYKRMMEITHTEGYDALRQIFCGDGPSGKFWPYIAGIFDISEPGWQGILQGSRDDGEVIRQDTKGKLATQTTIAGVRKVGTQWDSCYHGPGFNSREWNSHIWATMASGMTRLPRDTEAFSKVLRSPPVTSSLVEDAVFDTYLLNVDFGRVKRNFNFKGALQYTGPESISLGADNVWMSGVGVQCGNRYHGYLISGAPFTMVSYVVNHHVIDAFCKANGLNKTIIYGVGDDFQICGPIDELRIIFEEFHYALKGKGMSGNQDFILGHFRLWLDSDRVLLWTQPRIMKSVPSPKDAEGLPNFTIRNIPEEWIMVSQEAMESADIFWDKYADMMIAEYDMDALDKLATGELFRMKRELASVGGVSDWLMDMDVL